MSIEENKRPVIVLPHGMKREIARSLNVNERTVGRALRGETEGAKSEAVRRVAIAKLEVFYGQPLAVGAKASSIPSYLLEPVEYRVLNL